MSIKMNLKTLGFQKTSGFKKSLGITLLSATAGGLIGATKDKPISGALVGGLGGLGYALARNPSRLEALGKSISKLKRRDRKFVKRMIEKMQK